MKTACQHESYSATGHLWFGPGTPPAPLRAVVTFLLLLLPIQSVLLVPSIQGTTAANLIAFFSIVLCFLYDGDGRRDRYLFGWVSFLVIFALGYAASQVFAAISFESRLLDLPLVDERDQNTVLFRSSTFTQLLYLFADIASFLLFRRFLNGCRYRSALFAGALLLASYGFYEVLYHGVSGSSGDFLTNRVFGELERSGSLVQTMQLGTITLQRLKSLTGEPSMYALTILPYWIYAIHTGHKRTSYVLLFSLLLSTSTTAYLGVGFYALWRLSATLYSRIRRRVCQYRLRNWIIGTAILLVLSIAFWDHTLDLISKVFSDKLSAQDQSGAERYETFARSLGAFAKMNFGSKLFGCGFGFIRSSDLFSTVLFNIGILGLLLYTLLFAIPILRLANTYENLGLKLALFVIYIVSMVSVPEWSYLSTWLFLGLAYGQLSNQHAPRRGPLTWKYSKRREEAPQIENVA